MPFCICLVVVLPKMHLRIFRPVKFCGLYLPTLCISFPLISVWVVSEQKNEGKRKIELSNDDMMNNSSHSLSQPAGREHSRGEKQIPHHVMRLTEAEVASPLSILIQ
ncbi:unnamed protein product [Heterobilharzia americana]|nr:unnamed protein product [Heterobilharzia americana]